MGSKTGSEDSVPEFVFGKWIVYLCAVGNYGLAIGLPFAMSVLFVDWQETFGATRAQTAAVYSTNVSILFGAAIIPGCFTDRFGARFTVLVGSCLACLGCIASSFATSMNFLIVSNGVLGGYSVDATGSYTLILHSLGSISMVASMALILSQACSTYRTFERTDRRSEDV